MGIFYDRPDYCKSEAAYRAESIARCKDRLILDRANKALQLQGRVLALKNEENARNKQILWHEVHETLDISSYSKSGKTLTIDITVTPSKTRKTFDNYEGNYCPVAEYTNDITIDGIKVAPRKVEKTLKKIRRELLDYNISMKRHWKCELEERARCSTRNIERR
jgi:hypothetical protein